MLMLCACALIESAAACAARGPEANRSRFQRNVGVASAAEAHERAMRILRQYAFVVEQEHPLPDMVIQTRWKDRTPFDDEQALGIRVAQNRLFVTARPRGVSGATQTFAIDVAIENRVQAVGSDAWTEASASPDYEQWVNQILEDFRREYNVGVRR